RRSPCEKHLFQWWFDVLFGLARNQAISRDDSRAGIPPQYWVIIPRWPNRFGLFEPGHRLAQKIVSRKPAIRRVLTQFHLRPSLGHDSGIISVVVRRFHPGQQFLGLSIADAVTLFKAVGQCEQERDNCLLIFGINVKNIEADALSFTRFVEQTVALGFFERR